MSLMRSWEVTWGVDSVVLPLDSAVGTPSSVLQVQSINLQSMRFCQAWPDEKREDALFRKRIPKQMNTNATNYNIPLAMMHNHLCTYTHTYMGVLYAQKSCTESLSSR